MIYFILYQLIWNKLFYILGVLSNDKWDILVIIWVTNRYSYLNEWCCFPLVCPCGYVTLLVKHRWSGPILFLLNTKNSEICLELVRISMWKFQQFSLISDTKKKLNFPNLPETWQETTVSTVYWPVKLHTCLWSH